MDICFSAFAILVLSPLFLIIILALKLFNNDSGVFFSQQRAGKDEKIFKITKFKSMNNKKDNFGNLLSDNERLTVLGRFIRKTSLDELPQLINVLKGEMSLVGPRPLLIRYLPYYSEREKLRHTVRPGITGLAQVTGRNTLSWDAKLAFDALYTENITFAGDVKILWRTFFKVIMREGVIPDKKENYFDIERKNKLAL